MATINLGAIKFNWKGAYNSSTSYAVDDVVSSGGNSYVCIQAHSNQAVGNATAYWNIMSSAGTNGTNGTDLTSTLTAHGDIVYRDGSGLAKLAAGTSGHFLKTQGTGANPVWAQSGGLIKEIFTYNYNQGNFNNNTSPINQNFTPTVAGKCIIMWTCNCRANSQTNYYWNTEFNNGSTNNTDLRTDGSSTPIENTSHNHSIGVTAVTNNSTVANQQATVKVTLNSGDTANQSGDGDYEQTLVIMVI